MKKIISFLGISILGGVLTLGGYKLLFEAPIVLENSNNSGLQVLETVFSPTDKTLNAAEMVTDFTVAAEKTIHAVVHVKNTSIRTQKTRRDLFFGLGNGDRTYEQVGTGSGVIISADGYVVTNNHVIDGATELEITLNNKRKYQAELIGRDVANDIALLKIEADTKLSYIPFANSDAIKIGEWVLAVGNPYNLTSTVTAGIVSAKGRDLQGNTATDSFIQTDAAVNPGNSGGALVNTRGELVGINTAITSKTGSYIGYSFAIPSNIAKKIIDDILEFGKVQEAIIGFLPDLREDDLEGVRIGDFAEGSNAEKSGLKKGDVIVKINDVKISKFSELSGQLSAKRPGESVKLTIDRDGKILFKIIQLTKRIERFISRAYRIELEDNSAGVKITREDSNLKNGSSLIGFIITEINNQKITSAFEAVNLLDDLSKKGYRIRVKMIDLSGDLAVYFF